MKTGYSISVNRGNLESSAGFVEADSSVPITQVLNEFVPVGVVESYVKTWHYGTRAYVVTDDGCTWIATCMN